MLTGKYRPGQPPPELPGPSERVATFISWLLRDEVLEPVRQFAAICREAGYTPAAVALAWVLRNENVSSAIVGATRPEQVTENVEAIDVELSDDLVAAIEAALEPASVNDPSLTFTPPRRS